MAAKKQEFTLQELISMSKGEVKELAQTLYIKTHGLTKEQLIKHITGAPRSVSSNTQEDIQEGTDLNTECFEATEDSKSHFTLP